jgi:hypothetical protein
MKKIFKSCSLYRKPKGFYIFGYLRTPYGGVGRPPAINLPLTANPAEIGNAILPIINGLSGEVTDVDLASASSTFRAHLKDLGFKTVATFEKNASVVGLEFDDDFYSIVFTQKDEHGTNVHVGSKKLPANATAEAIGNAVLAALKDNR